MTFLEMCKRLRSEAGIAGTGPTTVISQIGELGRVVEWVLSAYEDIQDIHPGWRFLQTDFSFSTTIAKQNYTPAEASLTDLGSWKVDRADSITVYGAVADEQYVSPMLWEDFKGSYLFGSNRTQSQKPTIITVKPDNSISLWPIPDKIYTITGEYFKIAQTMALDADIPLVPSQYHMTIVWRGLMMYGAWSGESNVYMHGEREYKNLLRKMESSHLPQITYGDPLV